MTEGECHLADTNYPLKCLSTLTMMCICHCHNAVTLLAHDQITSLHNDGRAIYVDLYAAKFLIKPLYWS